MALNLGRTLYTNIIDFNEFHVYVLVGITLFHLSNRQEEPTKLVILTLVL